MVLGFAMILTVTLVTMVSPRAMAQTCSMNGKPVALDDGNTTAGKTGMMICQKDGKLWRKFEYKNGKQSGYAYYVNNDGAEEFYTDAKGNKSGPEKKFAKNGQLILNGTYENGDYVGLFQQFYDNGKQRTYSWYEKDKRSPSLEIEYNKDGSMESIKCGQKAFTDVDKDLCGFHGAHTVTLVGLGGATEKRTYENGLILGATESSKEGHVQVRSEFKDGLKHQRTFFDNGSLESDAVYKGSLKVSEVVYYMNGNRKSEITYDNAPKRSTRLVQEFSNSGKLSHKGAEVYSNVEGYEEYKPVGTQEDYFESGAPHKIQKYNDKGEQDGEQKVYDEKGTLRELKIFEKDSLKHAKLYDENGKLKSEREYFADGSYKEISK